MILVACEISQQVTIAFRELGLEAYSADVDSWYGNPTVGGNPNWHIQGDVTKIINDPKWKLVIAFPPCTHLAVSGATHFRKKREDGRQKSGIDFFMRFTRLQAEFVAIENPVGIMSSKYRKPNQIIQPFEFGDPYQKSTCLWLKNLPLLKPTTSVNRGQMSKDGMPTWISNAPTSDRRSIRAQTFPGIAKAMADQWGKLL